MKRLLLLFLALLPSLASGQVKPLSIGYGTLTFDGDSLNSSVGITSAGTVTARDLTTTAASGAIAILIASGSTICLDGYTCSKSLKAASGLVAHESSINHLRYVTHITGSTAPPIIITGGSQDGSGPAVAVKNASTLNAGQYIQTWAPDSAGTVTAGVDRDGTYSMDGTDSSGTPGAATINQPIGQVAVAASASSVVVTNSLVTSASVVLPVLQFVDATCTQILSCVPGAGSFTVTMNAACTADTKIGFVLHNYF
jgi:hypothetical protein